MPEVTIQQAFEVALQHQNAGRLQEAEGIYRQIVAADPRQVEALQQLGLLAHRSGRHEVAADLLRRVIALNPAYPHVHYNLGVMLRALGRLDEAIAAYRQAVAANPSLAVAHNNLGSVYKDKGQFDEAIAAYERAIAVAPGYAEAYNNLGNALRDKGRWKEAVAAFQRAIALKPGFSEAYCNLGVTLRDGEQLDEAIAAYRQAIALNPNLPEAHRNLGAALADKGMVDEATGVYRRALAIKPDYAAAHGDLVYAMTFSPHYGSVQILAEAREWNRRHAEPLRPLIQPHGNERSPGRRLRVGYVSPDFRDHVVGRNVLPLVRRHDRREFEITCYAQVPRPDGMTAEFQRHADRWCNIVGLSDEQVAGQIRRDRIDILVDLALHMADSRLLIFARKPAPVQATFAGYPGTTGLQTMDYRLTDVYLDPPGVGDECYSEESYRLGRSFWCYDPQGAEPGVGPLPAVANGVVTFGSLNNYRKVNEEVLGLWARVLCAVKDSRLAMLSPEGEHRFRALELLAREGVSSERIVWVQRAPRAGYLAAYNGIDIGLDTLPYNGHTTSLDSFWMGVPVVTLAGQTVAGRGGVSQLVNLGLPELIARSREEFVEIAAGLAGDLPRLSELRRTLRGRMEQSPLMDAERFTRDIEGAYRSMWQRWCAL